MLNIVINKVKLNVQSEVFWSISSYLSIIGYNVKVFEMIALILQSLTPFIYHNLIYSPK